MLRIETLNQTHKRKYFDCGNELLIIVGAILYGCQNEKLKLMALNLRLGMPSATLRVAVCFASLNGFPNRVWEPEKQLTINN